MVNRKEKKKPYRSVLSNALWISRLQMRYAPWSFVILLTGIPVAVISNYTGIYLPSLVVREVTAQSSFPKAAMYVGAAVLVLLLCELFTNAVAGIIWQAQVSRYRFGIRERIDRKMLGCFYQQIEKKETRELYDRAVRTTQQWGGKQPISEFPRLLTDLIQNVLSYILFGTVISFVHPVLVPILTVAPVVNWLCMRTYNRWEYNHRGNWSNTSRRLWYLSKNAAEFSAGKDIRIYGMAGWFVNMFRSLTEECAAWDRRRALRKFLAGAADLIVILLRDGVAYALLISMMLRGEISVDEFVLYFAAISSFADFIGRIVSSWTGMHSTSLKICDLREFLDLPEYDGTGTADISEHLGRAPEITFDRVSFRYDGSENDTLHNLSFTVKAGESIALVGLNGAGKTTIVKLLCGLYRPTSGEIRVNGVPVSEFLKEDYYRLFSPVFQEIKTSFFSLGETVSSTIGGEYDRRKAENCIRYAGLGEKLDSLPEGIDTKLDKQIHENGTELSGGELQKLMLARALYKNAPMLVLDEPTAALDPLAEQAIYRQYREMTCGKSAVFISHRLASTRFCDRILYLENGRIVEEGTHDLLVAKGGRYAELFDIQSCWYRPDYGKEMEK